MKFLGILLFIFTVPNLVGGQVLYKEFIYDMPIDQAKKILQKNSKTLKNINFGNGTSYAFRKRSLVDHDGRLVSINIWSNLIFFVSIHFKATYCRIFFSLKKLLLG